MMNLLIVDDDKLTRNGLIKAMPWREFQMRVVGEAANGLEALAFLERNPVDLVLCDIEMPHMQGLELIEKASALYPDMYFVVLTLYTDFARIQQALRLGAIDYIAKTDLDRESFRLILKRIVDRIDKESARRLGSRGHEVNPQLAQELAAQWKALRWLGKDELYDKLRAELRAYPQSSLGELLHEVAEAWNDTYALIDEPVVLPSGTLTADEAAAWLDALRDRTRTRVNSFSYSQEVFDCVLRAKRWIDQHLSEPLYACDVARSVSMSRSYFCQCFHDIFRMSFLEYLRMVRLQKALRLLRDTNDSIQSVAKDAGYTDEKYFSRIFKSVYGMVPSEYRKACRRTAAIKEEPHGEGVDRDPM